MNRTYAAATLATAIALVLGACGDDNGGDYYYGGSGSVASCGQYTTCGTCTPVLGCGWCFNSKGGVCTTDPNECAQVVSEFTWTWDPSGCPDVDASVAPVDASPRGSDGSSPRADAVASEDVAAPQADAAPPLSTDAGEPSSD
jgi:hypothetical protein